MNDFTTINLKTFSERISESFNVPLEDSKKILGYIVREMKYELVQGNRVVFDGIWSFQAREHNKKHIYSLKYNKVVKNMTTKRVYFRISRMLKEEINFNAK